MHQRAVPIRSDVRLHPKIPLVAFAGLVHFGVALLGLVLGRGRCGHQRGVHQRAFTQQQAARGKVGVDGGEDPFAQVVRFEEATEFQERGGVGHALGTEINAGQVLQRLAVVEGVFEGFVGEGIPLLEEIHPQHPLQSDGRTSAFALGIMRLDDDQQLGPRDDFLHAREELLAPGGLLLVRKLGLGKTALVGHAMQLRKHPPPRR